MKSNSSSRVTEALAILKESAEEFTTKEKPKRKVLKKAQKANEAKKSPRK
jgi:hypothetical protein